jgi:integrase
MTITVRQINLKDGVMSSLYLDMYSAELSPKRKKESLKLQVYRKPKSTKEREHNKKTLLLAESIRSKKLLETQHSENGFIHLINTNDDLNFIAYFEEQTEKRYNSSGNHGNWESTYKHIIKYCGDFVPMKSISGKWIEGFKDYLEHSARTKGNQPLSQNSKYSYFNKLKACIRQAMKGNLIKYDTSFEVKGFKQGDSVREYLTIEELKLVAQVDCEISQMKTAFLFSALSGLRWSDIQNLIWQDLQHSDESGWFIRFRQKKTKGHETLPLSQQARSLLGDIKDPDERIFKGLKYSAWHNLRLQQWIMKAGITKTHYLSLCKTHICNITVDLRYRYLYCFETTWA